MFNSPEELYKYMDDLEKYIITNNCTQDSSEYQEYKKLQKVINHM
jgi:hypothetical protein